MRTPYTATIFRYVHDVVAGEFANIGTLLYSPSERFLEVRFLETFGRLYRFFGAIPTKHLRFLVRELASGVNELSARLFPQTNSLFYSEKLPRNALECARLLLPEDDSSLQVAGLSSGVTKNPETTLAHLYERYIGRHSAQERGGRRDEEIWKSFKRPLFDIVPRLHLQPHRIVTANYEHEFPYSWRNGIINVAEPVSFDMRDTGEMLEKAARWVGRAKVLGRSQEPFSLILLIGEPADLTLLPYAEKAKNILGEIERKEIFSEENPKEFAEFVKQGFLH